MEIIEGLAKEVNKGAYFERSSISYFIDKKANKEYVIIDTPENIMEIVKNKDNQLEEYSHKIGYFMLQLFKIQQNPIADDTEHLQFIDICVQDIKKFKQINKPHTANFKTAKSTLLKYYESGNPAASYCAIRINEEYAYADIFYYFYYRKFKRQFYADSFKDYAIRTLSPLCNGGANDLLALQEYIKDKNNKTELTFGNLCNYDINLLGNVYDDTFEIAYTSGNLFSFACYILSKLKGIITFKKCANCGKIFSTTKQNIKKYCSEECIAIAKLKIKSGFEDKKRDIDRILDNQNQSYNNSIRTIRGSNYAQMNISVETISDLKDCKINFQIEKKRKKIELREGKTTEEDIKKWLFIFKQEIAEKMENWEEVTSNAKKLNRGI